MCSDRILYDWMHWTCFISGCILCVNCIPMINRYLLRLRYTYTIYVIIVGSLFLVIIVHWLNARVGLQQCGQMNDKSAHTIKNGITYYGGDTIKNKKYYVSSKCGFLYRVYCILRRRMFIAYAATATHMYKQARPFQRSKVNSLLSIYK